MAREESTSQQEATVGKFIGGPLDGQVLPLEPGSGAELVFPYGAAQIIYRQVGEIANTGPDDGAPTATYRFVRSTDDLEVHDRI